MRPPKLKLEPPLELHQPIGLRFCSATNPRSASTYGSLN
jgi:hypothetical protein